MRLATEITSNIRESIVDGEGFRIVMFTQGCKHYCKGCQNPTTWNMNGGIEYSIEEISEYILNMYKKGKGFYSGITISGGEPLLQKDELEKLLNILKNTEPDMNIWVYTGFEKVDVIEQFESLFKYVDVFVTGKFVEELKSYECKFRGSTNQELFYINKI